MHVLSNDNHSEPRDPWLGKGSPNRKQWGVYTPCANPLKSILMDLWIPWKLFMFPIVEFSSFVVSWSCSSFLTINLTESQNFAAPPYNYSPEVIGFMNFAILVGAMIGLATAGPLSDWVSARATRKNRGIREPEMRLPAMSEHFQHLTRGQIILTSIRSSLRVDHDARQLHCCIWLRTEMALGSHCHHRLHLRRNPSRRVARNGDDVRRRLVQASCWVSDGVYHGEQERLVSFRNQHTSRTIANTSVGATASPSLSLHGSRSPALFLLS